MEEKSFEPKRLGKFGLVMRFGGSAYLVCLVIGLLVLLASSREFGRQEWLRYAGRETTGLVTGTSQQRHSCGRRQRSTCISYLVFFRFDASGVAQTAHNSVSADYFHQVARGDTVKLRYLEEDPGFNQLEAGSRIWPDLLGIAIGLLFAGIGGYTVIGRVRNAGRLTHLFQNGLRRPALVTKKVATSSHINYRKLWKIEWQDTAGHVGESCKLWPSDLPEVGAEITIYTDPEGRFPSAWEGDCWAR